MAAEAFFGRSSLTPARRSISSVTMPPGTAIENEIDLLPEVGLHMGRTCRADLARTIGAGGGERFAEPADKIAGKTLRHANADGIEPGRRQRMNVAFRFQRQNERQWAGPEGLCEFPRYRVENRVTLGHGDIGHVADQRVELRPALGLVNTGDGSGIGGVGGKAIDGFRRQRDGPAVRKLGHGCLQGCFPLGFDVDMTRHDAAFQGGQ